MGFSIPGKGFPANRGQAYAMPAHSVPEVLPPSGIVKTDGTIMLGTFPAGSLTFGATSGSGVSCTGVGTAFGASDVDKIITVSTGQRAQITAFTSTTLVTVTILDVLPGTAFANLLWQLCHSVIQTYSRGCWMRLPAGAVVGGLAGNYWVVMSSTTVGQVKNVYLDPATTDSYWPSGAPANAVGSNAAYVQSTVADVTIGSTGVPAGLMGDNGMVEGVFHYALTNSGGTKTPSLLLSDGTNTHTLFSANVTNQYSGRALFGCQNMNSPAIQVPPYYNNSSGLSTQATSILTPTVVDTNSPNLRVVRRMRIPSVDTFGAYHNSKCEVMPL